jgi:hypothetical protein
VQRIDAVHLGAKHRHQRGKNIRVTRGAPRPEDALGLVDEEKGKVTFAPLLARGGKYFAHDPLRLAHPHVQDFRAFDVHEVSLHFAAAFFAKLFGQIVGGRFADERFAAARRAVEQETFRRRMLKFLKQLAVNERQLDRVLDRFQRLVLAAHFFPREFRDVVEVMLVRLRMRKHFERDAIIWIDSHFVASLEIRPCQLGGALQDQ